MKLTAYTTTKDSAWQNSDLTSQQECSTTLFWNGDTDQVWEGFGGCFNEISQKAIESLDPASQNQIYDSLFSKSADGVRFDFCRLPIGASD